MDKLVEEISIEKEYINETLDVLLKALNRHDKGDIELTAIGACLHHCYTGMENILKGPCKKYEEVIGKVKITNFL
jgi:hypothetical protein